MQNFKDLTTAQLTEQASVINSARYLMENVHGATESTVKELAAAFKAVNQEIKDRK